MTRREKVEEVVRTVLAPLIEADGGEIAIARFEGSKLTLRLGGALQGCPGTDYVKRGVIEPAIHAAVGKGVEIVYERASFVS